MLCVWMYLFLFYLEVQLQLKRKKLKLELYQWHTCPLTLPPPPSTHLPPPPPISPFEWLCVGKDTYLPAPVENPLTSAWWPQETPHQSYGEMVWPQRSRIWAMSMSATTHKHRIVECAYTQASTLAHTHYQHHTFALIILVSPCTRIVFMYH